MSKLTIEEKILLEHWLAPFTEEEERYRDYHCIAFNRSMDEQKNKTARQIVRRLIGKRRKK